MGSVDADVSGIERTSTVAERFFRCLEQRPQRVGSFMSDAGAKHFLEAWLVYVNCEP